MNHVYPGEASQTLAVSLSSKEITASLPAVADELIDNRPPLQAPGCGGDVHITIEGGINVHATPGMDEQALARMVDARVRQALEDPAAMPAQRLL